MFIGVMNIDSKNEYWCYMKTRKMFWLVASFVTHTNHISFLMENGLKFGLTDANRNRIIW